MPKILYTIDTEKDLHAKDTNGITHGLLEFERLCAKHKICPVLFVTGEVLEMHSSLFKRLSKKGWEISCHGFSHRRFDDLSFNEKEREIQKFISSYKKIIGGKPRGFRAPQHSIDSETLDLLEKYGFEYDSSYTPLNLLQFLFFPKRFVLNMKGFFSPLNKYRIRKSLLEIPPSSLLVPFVSLPIRVMPKFLIGIYAKLISLLYRKPVFYAHSWDFIHLKGSRIERMFSHKRFIDNLDYLMKITK